jgi:Rrf2 family protein
MKISAATSYALQSLIRLAHQDRCVPISATQLATDDMPRRFLPQVFHKLVEQKVLVSTAGATGGYYLARSPGSITLLEIMEAVEGTFSIRMARVPGLSTDAQNELTLKLADAAEHVRECFRAITLAQLAAANPNERGKRAQTGDAGRTTKNQNQITTIQLECPQQTAGSPP